MAVRYDASADRLLRTANVPDYNAAYTMSLWVNQLVSLGAGVDISVWSINTDGAVNYDRHGIINSTGHKMFSVVVPAAGGESNTFTSTITTNTWTHVAWVRLSNTQIAAYINGVQSGTTWTHTTVSGRSTSPTRFEVGAMATGAASPPLALRVHGIKFWSAALAVEQIQAEMRVNRPVNLASLEGWWPTMPGASLRLLDYSGKGRDFTAGGTLADEAPPSLGWGFAVQRVDVPAAAASTAAPMLMLLGVG